MQTQLNYKALHGAVTTDFRVTSQCLICKFNFQGQALFPADVNVSDVILIILVLFVQVPNTYNVSV